MLSLSFHAVFLCLVSAYYTYPTPESCTCRGKAAPITLAAVAACFTRCCGRAGCLHTIATHDPALTTNVAILGSTGSIGRSTLEVIAASEGRLRAVALTGHRNMALLERRPGRSSPAGSWPPTRTAAARHDWSGLPQETDC